MLTIDEAKDYLGIDYTDAATERRLTHAINVAEKYLEGSLGVSFPRDDLRAKELALIVVADLFDNRSMSEKVSGTTRKIVEDFSLQLRITLRYTTVTLTITAAPTLAGDATITLDNEETKIALDPTIHTSTDLVAALFRASYFEGWTTSGTGSTVTLTKNAYAASIAPTFSGGTTGATATVVKK